MEVIGIKIKKFLKFLTFLLVVLTLVSPMFLNGYGGYSIIYQAEQGLAQGDELVTYQVNLMETWKTYGIMMLVSSGAMVLAMVLCLCKLDIIPIILQTGGFSLCMVVLSKISAIADKYGLTDSELQPLSEKYFNHHMVTIFPWLLLVVICVMRFFSYEKRTKRRNKRLEKIQRDNAPCEKVVD
jgi:hypothetical protein